MPFLLFELLCIIPICGQGLNLLPTKYQMQFMCVPYVGLWVGSVPDVQLAQGQECDFSR